MTRTMAQILEAGRQQAGLSNRNLWISYYALGGMADPETLNAYLLGDAIPDHGEYDVIAQTLNEAFVGADADHPVPYAEDLVRRPTTGT
jgi:hypothetical protein